MYREADAKYPDFGAAWERARDEKYEDIFTILGRYIAYIPTEER